MAENHDQPEGRSRPSELARRELLRRLALTAGVALVPLPFGACVTARARAGSVPEHATFDAHEWAVVDAACARLIPSDDGLPGAREAKVVRFIDLQLAQPHFAVFKREFEAGVPALDLVAASTFGKRFLKIDVDQQDRVLALIQGGDGSTTAFSAAHFFQVLFTLTLEGFLSDPVYGGNEDGAGWKVIGYAPAPPRPVKGG